jgi:hypothetical protein
MVIFRYIDGFPYCVFKLYNDVKPYTFSRNHALNFESFFFLVVLGFELRNSHLLGRCFITWITPPAPNFELILILARLVIHAVTFSWGAGQWQWAQLQSAPWSPREVTDVLRCAGLRACLVGQVHSMRFWLTVFLIYNGFPRIKPTVCWEESVLG